jgi:2-polyprenyl-6-methoxyphenol hydroxylase-like FAD-dependent oxidoreductase
MPIALIVGAGIGGLAAGLALTRAGWRVRIFERAPAPRELGFGVGLAPNAIAALRELGVADSVVSRGLTPVTAEIRHVDGRVIRRLSGRLDDLPRGDLPSVVLRPVLHGALLAAMNPETVEVDRDVVGFELDGPRVRLKIADGTSTTGDILIGADGVGSTIRAQLHPAEAPARSSGYVAVRGVSPAVDRLDGLQAIWYFGRGVESGVVQAGPEAIYWFLSLLAADVRSGPMDVDSTIGRFAAGFDRQFHAVTGASTDVRLDELLEREPLARWGRGPVTLVGDAAHPMLPHTGQGAAQALEDAVGLGRALRGGGGDPIAALRRYEDVRSRRTRRVVRMGPRIARMTTTRNPVVALLRNTAIRIVPARVLVKAFTRTGADPNRELGEA